MVDIREERNESTFAKGTKRKTGVIQSCWFNTELHEQIRLAAVKQGWTFAHMVRHLCEASIDGIE